MRHTIFFILVILFFLVWTAICQSTAQQIVTSTSKDAAMISVEGCLSKDNESGRLILADVAKNGNAYYLIGHIAELSKYIGGELKVTGRKDTPPTPSSDYNPIPLKVKSWEVIVDPIKEIPPNVGKVADWESFMNRKYGIIIRFPKTFSFQILNDLDRDARLLSIEIPRDIYKGHTNFSGGSFSVSVTQDIDNAEQCKVSKESESRDKESERQEEKIVSRAINGITYIETHDYSCGLGHSYDSGSLQTYQNGLCYTFSFEFGSVSIGAIDAPPCIYNDYDTSKIIDLLLSGVSFIKPMLKNNDLVNALQDDQTTCIIYRKTFNGFKKNFAGTIGTATKVELQFKFENQNLSGTEQYMRIGKPLWLRGAIDALDNFTIEERYPEDHVTGIFTGKFSQSCQTMTGYFSKPDGSRLQHFEFHEIGLPYQPEIKTIPVGGSPNALAINSVTDKVYVASDAMTVINGLDNSIATIAVRPGAMAINPVTNKIYVINNHVTIIDGSKNTTTTIPISPLIPNTLAINSVTNKIYVIDAFRNTVTVIDGATNSTATVTAGTHPIAVAINPVTNKIYVANKDSANLTVIDGATNNTTTVTAGTHPIAVAVNPITNKIYVANNDSANMTVIDGVTNATITVQAGTKPNAVVVNSVTNKIYVVNTISNTVTVIDGATNGTATVTAGTHPIAVAINPVTNKIYVANEESANMTVIDGKTNSTITINVKNESNSWCHPIAVAVNPVTNKIYIANGSFSKDVIVITEQAEVTR